MLTASAARGSFARMIEQTDIIETVLRGAASGVSILLAIVLIAGGPGVRNRRLGALFTFSVGVYVLLAGEATQTVFGVMMTPAIIISILGTVFFWWFAASLFDDHFRWRWWRWAPAGLLPGIYLARQQLGDVPVAHWLLYLHLALNAAFFADAFRLSVTNAADDLVDPRRRFRVVIAGIVALFGMSIAAAEIIERNHILPDALRLFHAVAIFALNLVFGAWLLSARAALLDDAPPKDAHAPVASSTSSAPTLSAADKQIFEKLIALMGDGVFRKERLTVAQLAAEVGTPEHVLRRVINQELGYRNFSAFLGRWRIAEAQKTLSDPAKARVQVLQIALDVGYGSIGPFNRAFKEATGKTPTEFRKNALNGPDRN